MSYSGLNLSSRWRADNVLSQQTIPNNLRVLMTDQGSLTHALMTLSEGKFQVNVLNQGMAVPYWHEQRKLDRPLSRAAMVRQVELKIHGEAVVYARSIIPLALAMKGGNGLVNLGHKPLGHLLFKHGKIRVSKREFAEFQFDNKVIQARRTPYDFQASRILVTEVFLPALAKWF